MNLPSSDQLFIGWIGTTSVIALLLFGYDKWQAGREGGPRLAEFTLCLVSAIGGWPGGLFGMMLFRHKSAKASFQIKFIAAFILWIVMVGGAARLAGRW